jgi:hypothetical protein
MDAYADFNPFEGSMEKPIVDVAGIRRKYLDIPYAAQSPNQILDIYLPPDGGGPFPTVVFVHGGAFILGRKRDDQLLQVIGGIGRGYAVVSVEYRLADEAKYPAAVFDVKAALRFLRANAATYLHDGDRFALCGTAPARIRRHGGRPQSNPGLRRPIDGLLLSCPCRPWPAHRAVRLPGGKRNGPAATRRGDPIPRE